MSYRMLSNLLQKLITSPQYALCSHQCSYLSLTASQILTFDEHGISNHPNHYSLPMGAAYLLRKIPNMPIRILSLKTVPILPKYTGLFSPITTNIWYSFISNSRQPVFVAGLKGYRTALQAMYQHWSQLVWFRWLYVLFSRYMWVNEWHPVHIAQWRSRTFTTRQHPS